MTRFGTGQTLWQGSTAVVPMMHGGDIDGGALSWCKDVIFRAAATPSFMDQTFYAGNSKHHAPSRVGFAVRGLMKD